MTLGDIFWLFIMFSALQPWLRQRHERRAAHAQDRAAGARARFTGHLADASAGNDAVSRLPGRALHRRQRFRRRAARDPNAGTDVPLDIVLHHTRRTGPCGIADRPGDPRPQGKGSPCSCRITRCPAAR